MDDSWTLLLDTKGDASRALVEALTERWSHARQIWSQVDLPLRVFGPYAIARLSGAGDALEELQAMRLDDLYLACACVYGNVQAIAVLERDVLPAVDRRIRRIMGDRASADDLGQDLRHRLLLGDDAQPPRLASYSGRGALSNWIRVVGAREALVAKRRQQPLLADVEELEMFAPRQDFELDYLRRRYAEEFRLAFQQAFDELTTDERMLLRLHLVERVNIDQIAAAVGAHRATAARRLARVREHLATATRAHLMQQLALNDEDVGSILRMVRSQLDVSIHRMLVQTSS